MPYLAFSRKTAICCTGHRVARAEGSPAPQPAGHAVVKDVSIAG